MDFNSSLVFVGNEKDITKLEKHIDDMDFISEVESYDVVSSTNVNNFILKVETDNGNSMNIYDIIESVGDYNIEDVIYAITDGQTFIDVISVTGEYDTHIDNDYEMLSELCVSYGLDVYDAEDDEINDYDEENGDWD